MVTEEGQFLSALHPACDPKIAEPPVGRALIVSASSEANSLINLLLLAGDDCAVPVLDLRDSDQGQVDHAVRSVCTDASHFEPIFWGRFRQTPNVSGQDALFPIGVLDLYQAPRLAGFRCECERPRIYRSATL